MPHMMPRLDPGEELSVWVELDRPSTHQKETVMSSVKDPAPSATQSSATSRMRMDILSASLANIAQQHREVREALMELEQWAFNMRGMLERHESMHQAAGNTILVLSSLPRAQAILTRISQSEA